MYLQNALIQEIQNNAASVLDDDAIELVSFSVPGSGYCSPKSERDDPLGETGRLEHPEKGVKFDNA